MPYEKDRPERQYWWCPKWYWPFAVCSGIRTQHKWCYNFAWVKETGYGAWSHFEGCENGKLYTWNEPTFPVLGGFFGGETHPGGEWCFDSSRGNDEGRCDGTRTGLSASGLSASDPFVSRISWEVIELRSNVAETGTFDFIGENERNCQKGSWPWSRTLHEELVIASVDTRFANVQWYIGGIPILNNSGTVSPYASCRWSFPLPDGRSENRVVNVKYEIITETNKSTLRMFNDPLDGSYSWRIGMIALDKDSGNAFSSAYPSADFIGETCDFEQKKIDEMHACMVEQELFRKRTRIFRKPRPGEPVVVFSDEIWRFVPEERRELVSHLLETIKDTLQDNPELFTQAVDQLEQQIGFAGVSRFMLIGSKEKAHVENIAGQAGDPGRYHSFIPALIGLGIGLLVGRLNRRGKNPGA